MQTQNMSGYSGLQQKPTCPMPEYVQFPTILETNILFLATTSFYCLAAINPPLIAGMPQS